MVGRLVHLCTGGDTEMMKPGGQFDYTQDSINFEDILQKVILNAEKTRQKQKEEKEKQEKEHPTEKKGNRASNETTLPLVPVTYSASTWVNQ